jgi:hypothetical protein
MNLGPEECGECPNQARSTGRPRVDDADAGPRGDWGLGGSIQHLSFENLGRLGLIRPDFQSRDLEAKGSQGLE